ncbi:hypothetical protein ACE0DR_07285 [Azotobacter sp. CWF10]
MSSIISPVALLPEMGPGKAQPAGNGHSLAKGCNAAWPHFRRNHETGLFWHSAALLVVHLE